MPPACFRIVRGTIRPPIPARGEEPFRTSRVVAGIKSMLAKRGARGYQAGEPQGCGLVRVASLPPEISGMERFRASSTNSLLGWALKVEYGDSR